MKPKTLGGNDDLQNIKLSMSATTADRSHRNAFHIHKSDIVCFPYKSFPLLGLSEMIETMSLFYLRNLLQSLT